MKAFIFPGQGSQRRGMGEGLFERCDEFLSVEPQIDALLGYSVRELCLRDPENRLGQTQYTQPCLFVVNALHYFAARQEGVVPEALAGHSLGEYNALLAAGAFDLLNGVVLVKARAELMARARQGGMAAVVGLTERKVASTLEEAGLTSLDVANYNAPTQVVISGPVADLQRAGPTFTKAGATLYANLPVSAAFHSRYMREAGAAFSDFIASKSFSPLRAPVIGNVTGEAYPGDDPTETIRWMLVQQISSPVRWTDSVRGLLHRGITTFQELGPGTVLTRLVQQIQAVHSASAA